MSSGGISRRGFMTKSGAVVAALTIGWHLPPTRARAASIAPAADVNSWLRIEPDDTIVIQLAHAEMGQGVYTGMPMLIAEELEADWSKVRVERPLADIRYGTFVTAASNSTQTFHKRLRIIGAQARDMLRQAAALHWHVPVDQCIAESGMVLHSASDRKLSYGALSGAAAELPIPQDVRLKDPKDWKLLGTEVAQLDGPQKVDGTAIFGIDVDVPDMLIGALRICPVAGGKLVAVDDDAALNHPGVHSVVRLDDAVVVLAEDTWTAQKVVAELSPKWDLGAFATQSNETLLASFHQSLDLQGRGVVHRGDPSSLPGTRYIEATYEIPYLAHNTMEPLNATVHVFEGGAEAWVPTQGPVTTQMVLAKVLKLKPGQVSVHGTFVGGGFGRKASADFVVYAALAAKDCGRPVKLFYTRSEDLQHDAYRPMAVARLRADFDEFDEPIGLNIKFVVQSMSAHLGPPFSNSPGGVDFFTAEGLPRMPYEITGYDVEYVRHEIGLPVGALRSIGAGQNAFFVESFIDEMAHAVGKDPLDFRIALLYDSPRYTNVLQRVAEMAGWGQPLQDGRSQGVAVFEYHGTVVAEIAEISVPDTRRIRVHKVCAAVDCGRVLNSNAGRAQIEGSIIFGLSDALFGEVAIRNGAVQQSNFHDYRVLRIDEAPAIEVDFVTSSAPISGLGEPATPPVAPAVANAFFAATGQRVRSLPFIKST